MKSVKSKVYGLWIVALLCVSAIGMIGSGSVAESNTCDRVYAVFGLENQKMGMPPGVELLYDYGSMKIVGTSEKNAEVLKSMGLLLVDVSYMRSVGMDTGTFDPQVSKASTDLQGKYFLVQFERMPTNADISMLGKFGNVLMYFPYNTYLVYSDTSLMKTLANEKGVRWVGNYEKEYKLHPALSQKTGKFDVTIQMHANENLKNALKEVLGYTEHVYTSYQKNAFYMVKAQISHMALRKVLDIENVLWVEPYVIPKLADEVAVEIHTGAYAGPGGYIEAMGWQGDGVVVGLADTGLDDGNYTTMHPDLYGRVVGLVDYTETDTSDGVAEDTVGHGTHCAGIIAGNAATGMVDENGYLYGYGVAPKAKVVMQRIFNDYGYWAYNKPVSTMTSWAANHSVKVHSNSWGAAVAGDYDDFSQDFDWAVRDANPFNTGKDYITYVFAAGNAGPGTQTVGSPGTAKNVITVAASENNRPALGSYADNPEEIADFSSRGPAADGRWKPEIAAVGTWVASALSSSASPGWGWGNINEYYEWCGGTSMATPHVAGGAVLFFEYYNKTYGKEPTPALVKAALVNGADDMLGGPSGGSAPVPNKDEGWGRMNLTKVIQPDFGVIYADAAANLKTGDIYEKDVKVIDGTKPLKVTMSYLDMPAAISANPTLVNDLNLIVIAPDNTIYYGNAFANGWSIPGAMNPDNRNNLENVFIENPMPGTYRVIVSALNVVQDAVNETPELDQDFSLVISGNIETEHPGSIKLDKGYYTPSDTVTITVVDQDLNTNPSAIDTVSVTIDSSIEPYGETVLLSETGVNTGIFKGAIPLKVGVGAPADGYLEVKDMDNITARYFDMAPLGWRTATAVVDGIAPEIWGVHVVSVKSTKAVIAWTTDEPATSVVYYWEASNPVPVRAEAGISSMSNLNMLPPNKMLKIGVEKDMPGIPMEVKAPLVYSSGAYVTDHIVELKGLKPETKYFFYVESVDPAGNSAIDNNYGANYTFTTLLPPDILFVDDDAGATYDQFFTASLDNAGYSYDVWDVNVDGSPGLDVLQQYAVVIWSTGGDYSSTLSDSDEANLASYLDSGGKLFLSSQDYLWDMGLTSFGRNYLHIAGYRSDVGASNVTGVTGDPISNGLGTVYLSYPFWDYSDNVTPDASAYSVFTNPSGQPCAIRYEGTAFKTVFFGFPFEAIANRNLTNGTIVIDRIIKWLNPPQDYDLAVTSIATNKSWSRPGESITITGTIKNKGMQNVTNIEVKFYADSNLIDVQNIPALASGKSITVSTAYVFPVEGKRPISIEVTPLAGENNTANNVANSYIYVRTPAGSIKVGVVKSFGSANAHSMVWSTLENTWYRYSNYMFTFDASSLDKEELSLEDFIESGVDVLYISDAWNPNYWQYTDTEIQAIKTYVMMGHGIIATSGTLSSDVPNNMKLADVFGLNVSVQGYWADYIATPGFTIYNTSHPVFNEISSPYMPGLIYACVDHDVVNADVLAEATSTSGYPAYITEHKYAGAEAIYFAHIPEYAPYATADDTQLVANAIIWAYMNTTKLPHELFPTTLTLPDYTLPNQQIYINSTVFNAGTNTETNVSVQLIVNSVVNATTVISSIAPNTSAPVSFTYTQPAEGTYTIQIHVEPVGGETETWNNDIFGELRVIIPKGPIRVVIVDSWGLDYRQYTVFSEIEQMWYKFGDYMIEFDYTSLDKENITSDDLMATEAHVLFISNAWDNGYYTGYNWEFTDAEIQALKDYINYGHGAVATGGTFGNAARNNMKLAPAFGIAQSPYGQWGDEIWTPPGYTVLVPTHPVFNGISNPYLTGEEAGYMLVTSGLMLGTGTKLANATSYYGDEAFIVNNTYGYGATVYTSGIPEYVDLACKADKQFVYNAILYAFKNTTYLPTLLHTPVKSAPPNIPIPISVVAKEIDDGVKNVTLYYTNVGSTTYTAVPMVRTSGDAFNGTWNATIGAQASTGNVYYYFVAYDNGGHAVRLPLGAPASNYTIVIDATPPEIQHTPPAQIEVGSGCSISAQVTDNGEVGSVFVNYTDPNGVVRNETMMYAGGNTYAYFFPPLNKTGTLYYTISAVDKVGNWNFTMRYSVPVVDTQYPAIEHIPVQRADAMVPFDIICKATDNYGIQGVWLRYTTPNNQSANVSMTLMSPNYYKYTVPGQPIGTFRYSIYAVDISGLGVNTTEYTVPVVDITPPTIQLIYPTPAINTSHVTIFAYCNDSLGYSGLGTAEVYVDYIDFTPLIMYDGDYINCTIPFELSDGSHILRIDMWDRANNYATLTTSFTVDTTGPSLAVASPIDGAVLSSEIVNVTGTTDTGAEVVVNGNTATVLPTGEFYCEITLSEGVNTITVSASDTAGNTRTAILKVIVDTIDPQLTVYSPVDGTTLNTTGVLVTGKVVEQNLDKLEINGYTVPVATDGSFGYMLYFGEGIQTIAVTATDKAGHVVTKTLQITIDTVPPSLTVMNPQPGTYIADTVINVTGTTEPGSSVFVNGYNATVFSDGAFYYLLTVSDGKKTINVVSIDAAGNRNTKTLDVIVDATAPVLTLTAPANNTAYNKSTVFVTGTLVEQNLKYLSINGIGISMGTGGSFGYYLTLADGTHEISVVAEDMAGNTVTVKRTVIVDTKVPVITVSAPTDGAYLTNETAVVSGMTEPGATLKINGDTVSVSTSGSFSTSVTLTEGVNTITFVAVDIANNTYSTAVKVIVDTMAPNIIIISPQDGSTFNTTDIRVYGHVDEANLKNITVNGGTVIYGTGGDFITTLTLPEGENTISVIAEDMAGHSTTKEITVTIDTTPPLLRATLPTSTSDYRLTFNGTTERGADVYVNGNKVSVNTDGTFSATVDLKDGANLIVITAVDSAGNRNTQTYSVLCTKSISDQMNNMNNTIDDQKNLIDKLNDDIKNMGNLLLYAVIGLLIGIIITAVVLLLIMRRKASPPELTMLETSEPAENIPGEKREGLDTTEGPKTSGEL